MKRLQIITIHEDEKTVFYAIYDIETRQYFAGYDFMGSVDWQNHISEEIFLETEDEAEQIIRDLEAADEPAKMTRYKKYYQRGKAKAHDAAVEFQYRLFDEENPVPWWEVNDWVEYFRKLGKRFGLMEEFKENAVI